MNSINYDKHWQIDKDGNVQNSSGQMISLTCNADQNTDRIENLEIKLKNLTHLVLKLSKIVQKQTQQKDPLDDL